jgi:hypothetical protein
MSFGLYMIGYIIVVLGVAIAMYLLRVPATWIGVAVLILFGLGILLGVTSTRHRDPSV